MRRVLSIACAALAACSGGSKENVDVVDPSNPMSTVVVQKGVLELCELICEKLVESYGVPSAQNDTCVFQCASGFNEQPDACYELVSCIESNSLCQGEDVTPDCRSRAEPCFDVWGLANGLCRSCWAPSGTVEGTRTITYRSDGPEETRPELLSTTTIAAHLPLASGTWLAFPGSGDDQGQLTIPGVPGCEYWLQIGHEFRFTADRRAD